MWTKSDLGSKCTNGRRFQRGALKVDDEDGEEDEEFDNDEVAFMGWKFRWSFKKWEASSICQNGFSEKFSCAINARTLDTSNQNALVLRDPKKTR